MADDTDAAIKVEHLNKTFRLPHEKNSSIKGALINFARHKRGYENQHVLKDVSFEVKKGEFYGIVGRNGSGKSTLLKLLAGIYAPDSGNLQVNGKLTPFIELGVGFNHELTGRENVFLNGALLGFNRKEMQAMYRDIVEFAELERFMDQKLKNYSSGMQVRLAFSIAIRVESDILVLDEVLAVGDAAFQQKCNEYFYELKKRKQTVVLVTHDMGAVKNFCDRALLVHRGKIEMQGNPSTVAQEYARINTPKEQDTKKGRKWSTGELEVVDCKILSVMKNSVFAPDDRIRIALTVEAKEDVSDPVIGITVNDMANREIFVTNTMALDYKTGKLKSGTTKRLIFDIENVFNDGTYMVSAGAATQNLTRLISKYEDACRFVVRGWKFPTGIVQPHTKIKVETA